MDQNKNAYFYNNQYEGGVADKYTFCTGASRAADRAGDAVYDQELWTEIYTLAADYNFGS